MSRQRSRTRPPGATAGRNNPSKGDSNRSSPQPPAPQTTTFQQILHRRLTPAESAGSVAVEPLAHLDYERELSLKNDAFGEFWKNHNLAGRPDPITPSPLPRHYRTTTRRRGHYKSGRLQLGFDDPRQASGALPASRLEPEAHTAIYRFLAGELAAPASRAVATHLNYIIIRGSYEAFSVIFNLDLLNGSIVRRLKTLAERLQSIPQSVVSAFVFCDPSRSDYYFEREAPPVPVRLKKLYGPARFMLNLGGHRYALPPTSFTQVNESMIGPMLACVRGLLRPQAGDRLLDLYCGYGLFAHDLADICSEAIGLDVDREAVEAAVEHLRHEQPKGHVTFLRRDISAENLDQCLPDLGGRELVILDPPRHGTTPGVIDHIATRRPERVLHLFCGVEALPEATAVWKRCGYDIVSCRPLDMFAGTPNLEALVLLEPKRSPPHRAGPMIGETDAGARHNPVV